MAFEPGSAVEVSIDGGAGALGRSWFSDRFLVLYPNVAEKSTVSFHQLRLLPPPETRWIFHYGKKVEVSFGDSERIDVWLQFSSGKAITAWLQVLANVNILALCVHAIRILHLELSNPISMKAQPPNFARLELLIVKQQVSATISNKKVNTVLEYLLQNTPMAYKVDIIHKQHLFK
ncbi:hypothetical protein glysoja_040079 [Glycine soja]|uniref:Uncharacterized protein n=1 Tax=Glycine soja TaxID=3848 RepID=A0A0B2SSN9_GLYSO|nr:hypothetical protein glysoja_040079 [Glycine soja]